MRTFNAARSRQKLLSGVSRDERRCGQSGRVRGRSVSRLCHARRPQPAAAAAKAQTLSYDISAVNTGRYTGCGIADGARILYADAPLFIAPYGLCVRAREAAGKAALDVSVEVVNESDAKRKAVITLYVFGPRGRRLTKKTRTVQIAADSSGRLP